MVVAEKIDPTKPIAEDVHPEISATYGQYMAVSCTGCHGENYREGDAIIRGSPKVLNIRGAGSLS